jgi:hypothetical protein
VTQVPLPSIDLTTRLRRAIAHNDAQELTYLRPIIRGLTQGRVQLSEIEGLSADVARRLVFARDRALVARRRGDVPKAS